MMQVSVGCVVQFKTHGTDYKGGNVQDTKRGKVMKTGPEGVWVTTGMSVWLVPFRFIVDVQYPARAA